MLRTLFVLGLFSGKGKKNATAKTIKGMPEKRASPKRAKAATTLQQVRKIAG